jgi:hypothetical protein
MANPAKNPADASCYKKVAFWEYSEVISFTELYK